MKAEDIYPNLAVWIRGNYTVWPGIVTKAKQYVHSNFRGYLNPTPVLDGFMVIDEIADGQLILKTEIFCFADELEPRDPNNLNEVPPSPLQEFAVTVFSGELSDSAWTI